MKSGNGVHSAYQWEKNINHTLFKSVFYFIQNRLFPVKITNFQIFELGKFRATFINVRLMCGTLIVVSLICTLGDYSVFNNEQKILISYKPDGTCHLWDTILTDL